jgi:hypothetical protein
MLRRTLTISITALAATVCAGPALCAPIPNPKGTVVFLGLWPAGGLKQVLTADTGGILNSPYMDALRNAGYGVGRGAVDSQVSLRPGEFPAGSVITNEQVQQTLGSAVGKQLPGPDPDRLYVVFTPPNVVFTAAAQGQMFSSATNLTGWNDALVVGNTLIRYAVVPFPGGANVSANGQGNHDALTEALSHEIAEAATGQQIADLTQRFHVRMSNGIAVQEVGQRVDPTKPLPVPGATPLPD